MTAPNRLNPPTLPNSEAIGYSQISITTGRLAFVSGQVAIPADGGLIPADIVSQTDLIIANLTEALKALEASPHDIAQIRIYVVDMTPVEVETVMRKMGEFLSGAKPSLTGIGVSALASPEFLLEIEMVVQLADRSAD